MRKEDLEILTVTRYIHGKRKTVNNLHKEFMYMNGKAVSRWNGIGINVA